MPLAMVLSILDLSGLHDYLSTAALDSRDSRYFAEESMHTDLIAVSAPGDLAYTIVDVKALPKCVTDASFSSSRL